MKRRTKGERRKPTAKISRLDSAILQACVSLDPYQPVRAPRLPNVRDEDVVSGLRRLSVFWDREIVWGPIAEPPDDLAHLVWPPRREDWVYPLWSEAT